MQTTQMVGLSSLRHLCETVGVSNDSFMNISVYLIECIPALELAVWFNLSQETGIQPK